MLDEPSNLLRTVLLVSALDSEVQCPTQDAFRLSSPVNAGESLELSSRQGEEIEVGLGSRTMVSGIELDGVSLR